MKRFFLFALVATALAACSTDTTQDLAPEIPTAPDELQVSFDEEDTRIQLGENGAPVWTEGDLVSVFYKSDGNDCYKFTGKTGDREGTLKRTSVGEWSRRGDNVVVVYPYSKSYIISLSANTVEASLPAEQTYAKNSYGIGSSLMIATGDYKQFALKNVCGWLKLQFTGTGYVSKIVLRGNNGEQVAGNMLVCANDASCILAEASADIDDDEVGGALITDGDILTSVTLNCGDGVALNSETPTAFYIALPPQTFEKGLTATIYGCDGSTKEISTKNLITIERNHILPMASATLEMPITNNEIWYTSSDGNVVEPNATDVFGANITSNTYENGVGVITFDGDVTTIGDSAFRDCDALTSVTIGDSVTKIGVYAFRDCDALTSVTIPDSVTTIGYHAFYNCDALTSVTIPDSVTTIGSEAFRDCNALTSVTIPDSVTTIGGSAFYYCDALTSVTIPDSVTTIGDWAFTHCRALTSITIPNSVTEIGENAFCNCDALKSVTIPDSVTTIGSGAFYGCTTLKTVYCKPTTPPSLGGSNVFDINASGRKIYVPNTSVDAYKAASRWSEYADAIIAFPNNQIWYTSSDGNIVTPYKTDVFGANIVSNTYENGVGVITFDGDVTKIGEYALAYCNALTSVTIPDSVTTIEIFAFYKCSALTSITIPDSVTKIGNNAFNSCSALTSITIPDSVTTIGGYAFRLCDALKSITIPDSVTAIGSGAFTSCSALKAFYGKFASEDNRCLIVNGVLNSFAPAGLTEYTIPDSVTTIGGYAFCNCDALKSVTIPDSVTTIGRDAFDSCDALTSVTIPDSVTTIGDYAFQGCDALTSITIPDSVTTIGRNAFADCKALTSITIPNGVTTIGKYAFHSCTSLKTVYCKPTTPPSLGSAVFFGNASGRKIYVPTASVNAYKAASRWSEYADAIDAIIAFPNNQIWYTSSDGNVVEPYSGPNNNNATAMQTFGANITSNTYENGVGVITFDGDVTTIGDHAFYNCDALTSVTIPDSVTEIGKYAFLRCSALTSVTIIGNSVTTIGDYAFCDCSALTSVTIPDSVTTIGRDAFYYCSALTSVTIGDSVTTIGFRAFYNCSALTSVTIPNSVTTIGAYAFLSCDALKEVYCKPTTPPRLYDSATFDNNASGRKIYVPTASVSAYKSATYWSEYASAIYPYAFTE